MTDRELCEYTLDKLRALGADMAQCRVNSGRMDELNVESGEISLLRTTFSKNISMKAVKSKRKGTITLNSADKASIDEACAACVTAAEAGVEDDAEGVSELTENRVIDECGAPFESDLLYDRIAEFLADSKTHYPKLLLERVITSHHEGEITFLNTNGVELGEKYGYYEYSVEFSSKDGEKASSFNFYGERMKDFRRPLLENPELSKLLDNSAREIESVPFAGKCEGTMVVTPNAIGDIIYALAGNFLSDSVLIEGTSLWKDKLGETVASPCLTLRADPYADGVVCGGGVTGDGYIEGKMDIIRDGVLKNFLLTRYGAAKTGGKRAENQGSGITIDAGDKSLADIIKGVKRGVLVYRFSGANPGVSGEMSGVAKNSFLIEDGKLGPALSETTISGNINEFIKNISGISRERVSDGTGYMPWVAFDGVTISGK